MSTKTKPFKTADLKKPNKIARASGKGGVGKTWFSITLSHALAKQGSKVLLFDGDLGLANLDIQLGLMPKQDLSAVIAGRLTLNQAIIDYTNAGFHVIAGRSGSGGLSNVTSSRLQILTSDLNLLAPNYDFVIVDLGAGVERTARQLAYNASTCIVLLTDEPTSLTDAYAFIKVTNAERSEIDFQIVANSVNSTREGERTYNTLLKACEGFLKISPPLLGTIRRDPMVKEAIRNQIPLLSHNPNTEAAEDVNKIAANLLL